MHAPKRQYRAPRICEVLCSKQKSVSSRVLTTELCYTASPELERLLRLICRDLREDPGLQRQTSPNDESSFLAQLRRVISHLNCLRQVRQTTWLYRNKFLLITRTLPSCVGVRNSISTSSSTQLPRQQQWQAPEAETTMLSVSYRCRAKVAAYHIDHQLLKRPISMTLK